MKPLHATLDDIAHAASINICIGRIAAVHPIERIRHVGFAGDAVISLDGRVLNDRVGRGSVPCRLMSVVCKRRTVVGAVGGGDESAGVACGASCNLLGCGGR